MNQQGGYKMKTRFLSLTLLSSFIMMPAFASYVSDINFCIEHIEEHYYAQFKHLDLYDCAIEDKDIAIINSFTQTHEVEYLGLIHNKISEIGAAELATNKTVKSLSISNNNIKDEGAIELAKNITLSNLDVVSTQIGDKGIAALALNKTIQSLEIGYDKIGLEGASALASNTTLVDLTIRGNSFDHSGITELVKNSSLSALLLDEINLSANDLQEFAKMTSLEFLGVFGIDIGYEGLRTITSSLPNLKALYMLNTNLNDQSLIELAHLPKLTWLGLDNYPHLDNYSKNQFSIKGIEALVSNSSISFLSLGDNGIDDEGVTILATSPTIEVLYLDRNNIGDEGAIALSKNTTLQFLEITYNHIGKLGRKALKASSIKTIYMDGNDSDLKASVHHGVPENRLFNHLCKFGSKTSVPLSDLRPGSW